ncbi:MAG: CRISPR-associated protein Cas6 [Paenibacillus sp.]|nr:CRISPR-associated protein Cas6 [Paenibacillus sp.]
MPMIASMVLILQKLDDIDYCKIYPYFIHGWIYSKIRRTEVGQYYHESEKSPFAIKHIGQDKRDALSIQVIFFDYRILLEFYRSLIVGEKMRLGDRYYLIEHCAIHPEKHPDAQMMSYDSFLQLPISSKILMKFKQTAFNHDHKTIVLPIPENIVGSIFRKWNDFSGNPLTTDHHAEMVRKLASGMLITSHNIGTELYYIRSDIKLTTFSGRVVIENIHHDPHLKQNLNTLLYFSKYSGIGWKCAYGMGSIEVTPMAEKHADFMANKKVFSS